MATTNAPDKKTNNPATSIRNPDGSSGPPSSQRTIPSQASSPITAAQKTPTSTVNTKRTLGKGTKIEFDSNSAGEFQIGEGRGNTRVEELSRQSTASRSGISGAQTKTLSSEDARAAVQEAIRIVEEQETTPAAQPASGKPSNTDAEHANSSNEANSAVDEAERIVSDSQKKSGSILKTVVKNSTPVGIAASLAGAASQKLSGGNLQESKGGSSQEPLEGEPSEAEEPVSSSLKPHKNTATGKAGRALLYSTPAGFVVGFLGSRAKQRVFGKKTVEEIEKEQSVQKKHSKHWGMSIAKNLTPVGIAASIGKLGINIIRGKQNKNEDASLIAPDTAKHKKSRLFSIVKNITPLGIATTVTSKGVQKVTRRRKNAFEYQKEKNDQIIALAKLRGFNPKALYNKLRDSKVWKMREWGEKKKNNQKLTQGKGASRSKNAGGSPSQTFAGYSQNIPTRFFSLKSFTSKRILGGRSAWIGGGTRGSSSGYGTRAVKKAGKKLAGKALQQLEQKAAAAIIGNPPVLLGIGIALLVVGFFVAMLIIIITATGGGSSNFSGGVGGGTGGGSNGGTTPPNTNPIPGFTINKQVDKTQITYNPSSPERITYTITYSYTPSSGTTIQISDITISDKISSGAKFISASGNSSFDTGANTVSWKLSDPANTSPLTLIVEPVSDNIIISNSATAMVNSTQNVTTPNSDTCNGYYTLTSPSANFGDPNCDFATDASRIQAQNAVGEILKSQDPNNADAWFQVVIPKESSWNPNAFSGSSTSGNGAYGLYQMNPKGKSTSGPNDVGNVGWSEQTTNAMGLAATLRANGVPYAGPPGYWQAWQGVTQR